METKSAVCKPEANGGITLWITTQGIYNARILLGYIYKIENFLPKNYLKG